MYTLNNTNIIKNENNKLLISIIKILKKKLKYLINNDNNKIIII